MNENNNDINQKKDNKEINNTNLEEIKEEKKSVEKDNKPSIETEEKKNMNESKKKDKRVSISRLINKDLPLFEIMKMREKDINNYDRISFEFNKLFKIYKANKKAKEKEEEEMNNELLMLNGKSNVNDKINKKDKKINLDEIIEKLKIPTEKRTMKDIHLIRKYLKRTKIGHLFQNEIKPKGEIYNKLLTFLSFQMKFEKVPKDEILFNIGSRTDFFYLIMEGRVEILKPMSKIYNISGYEYFLQLMNYRKKNEKYLYSLCIKENLRNFEIKPKDGELIPYIYLTYKLDEIKNRYFVDFKAVFDLISISPEELGLDSDKIHLNGYMYNKVKMVKNRLPIITQHELTIYKFLDDNFNKKEVILFQYQPFLRIGKNEFFGEASFSGKGVRNGTAKIIEDCFFGYVDIQLYNSNFYQEKKAIFDKKVNFLYTNFFFGKISLRKFENQFFNWFISEEYNNNSLLYKENSPCNFIYFIEDGIIELNSSRTILDIQMLLQDLEEKRLELKEKKVNLDYNNIKSDWNDIEDHVVKNQTNKILILGKNNILGLESFYYQIPYITNARVISPKAKVIKIDKEHLYQILIRSSECLHELESKVHKKIKIITKRFFSLNNVKLMLIDNKIAWDEQLKYENYIKEKKEEAKLRIISPFPEKKFEIIKKLNIKDEVRGPRKLMTALVKNMSTKNLTTKLKGLFEKKNETSIEKKDDKKKKYLYDFLLPFPEFGESTKKNNRSMINSASSNKNDQRTYTLKNADSKMIEDNLLKKVKKEIKILNESKYFMTKINTEKNEEKEKEKEKTDRWGKEKEFFMRKYVDKYNSNTNSNLSKINDLIESKKKDNIYEKSDSSIFITKFEEKNYNKNTLNTLNEKNISTTIDNKREITSSLPSIVKSIKSKKIVNSISIGPNNDNLRSMSIDNKNKSLKNLNLNFRYNCHLIKSYSYINKNNKNDIKTLQLQDLKIYDPKEKYNIFNQNKFDKKKINYLQAMNKLNGLNEFSFPSQPSKPFIPKSIKSQDFKIKMKKYQDYRRRLQRKIEEINQVY